MSVQIRWKGPDNEISSDDDRYILSLCSHPILTEKYSYTFVLILEKTLKHTLRTLRLLYKKKKLYSQYHNFAHHYVTTVIALRAVIGALLKNKKVMKEDILSLLIASLLHDIGYLQYNTESGKPDVHTHNTRSYAYSRHFCKKYLKFSDKMIQRIVGIQKCTEYDTWKDVKIWKSFDLVQQIMIGADLLQVADVNYSENRKYLHHFLFSSNEQASLTSEQLFFKLAQTGSYFIWDYLDAFYEKQRNPYREQWKVYKNSFDLKLDVPI